MISKKKKNIKKTNIKKPIHKNRSATPSPISWIQNKSICFNNSNNCSNKLLKLW